MHVHTVHSGMCSIPGMRLICRESYNEPDAVYQALKRQGMDLVTVTDHDSIDAAENLRRHNDFFLSEEVTCRLPSGTEIHVGVYDITERDHIELQRRADDFLSLHAYLTENEILFSANHIFSQLTGARAAVDFEWFEHAFPAFETRNGCILEGNNKAAAEFARLTKKAELGGSDAHSRFSLGSCWTSVPGARSKREFFDGIRHRTSQTFGPSGSYWKLTRDVLWIGWRMLGENPFTLPVLALAPLAPAITAINYGLERLFVARWSPRVLTEPLPVPSTGDHQHGKGICEEVAA